MKRNLWSSRRRPWALVFIMMALTLSACLDDQDSPGGAATLPPPKQTEQAARPTPTPIPPVVECPGNLAICGFAAVVKSNLAEGRAGDVVARASALRITCRDMGGMTNDFCASAAPTSVAEGLILTASAKPVDFVAPSVFASELTAVLGRLQSPNVISIGCAAPTKGSVGSCDRYFTLAIGDPSKRGESPVVLLFFEFDSSGQPLLRGAAAWVPTEAPTFGGSLSVKFLPPAFGPYQWFTPWMA